MRVSHDNYAATRPAPESLALINPSHERRSVASRSFVRQLPGAVIPTRTVHSRLDYETISIPADQSRAERGLDVLAG